MRHALMGALALALVCGFAVPSLAMDWRDGELDPGGNVQDYIESARRVTPDRDRMFGRFVSAAALRLTAHNACVFPDNQDGSASTVVDFHAATHPSTGQIALGWTDLMLAEFRLYPKLHRAIKPWMRSIVLHKLNGSQLIALGVPNCWAFR